MIRKILGTLVLLIIGGALTAYGLSRHFIRTDDGTLNLPKGAMAFSGTYVDIRDWSAREFDDHPEVTAALIEHGHQKYVPFTSLEGAKGTLRKAAESILGGDKDE